MKCKHWQSQKIVKTGKIRVYQRFKCKDCDRHYTNTPLRGKPAAMKALAVVLYSLCNASYGMLAKLLRVSNVAVYKWIKAEDSRLSVPSTQSAQGII